MGKLGIMGGTFDPIHLGHLMAASASKQSFGLEQVIFVPAGTPPHKYGLITPATERLAMVERAIEDNPDFEVSDFEVCRASISYTVDTISHFRQLYSSEMQLYFITGADAILEILTWREVSRLVEMCQFIAVSRPGYAAQGLDKDINRLPAEIRQRVSVLVVPGLNISSTDIRARVKSGLSISHVVPPAVEQYILDKQLYIGAV